jgi:nitroreductase
MTNPIASLIESRVSTNHYDTARSLSDDDIRQLVASATRAPSAFNLQNWKFIAVRTTEGKERLKALAFNQPKVADAAVTIIVCGTLNPQESLPHSLKPSVDAGVLPQALFDSWVQMAKEMYSGNPQFQRDEAIRSAALAGMTLMLAAQGMGLSSGPMIGFDPKGVAEAFKLRPDDVPAMLVTVGYPAAGNWPQKPRLPVHEVLAFA